jgi:excinuclease UvrABC ATPase subunit
VVFECASVSRSEEVRFDHHKTVEARHGSHEEQSVSTIHEQVRLPPVWLDVTADLVKRLRYLIGIGLGYLSLSRVIATLLLVKIVRHL